MNRPFALLGFTALITLAMGSALGSNVAKVAAWVCLCLGTVSLVGWIVFKKHKQVLWERAQRIFPSLLAGLFCMAIFLGWFSFSMATRVAPYVDLDGRRAVVRGQILDYPEQAYGRTYYSLRVRRVRLEGQTLDMKPFTVRLGCYQPLDLEPYDLLECDVRFYSFDGTGGLFSVRNSRFADGIVLGASLSGDAFCLPDAGSSPAEFLVRLREQIGRNFEKLLPHRDAGLIRAILLGQREQLDDTLYRSFQNVGAAHLLVVSGVHMAALAGLIRLLMSRLPFHRNVRNGLSAGALIFFLAMIGFPSSAVRSGIMYLIFLLGDSLGREPDPVNSLGLAVLILCTTNPFSGGDLGFALSVTATLGVLLFAGGISKGLRSLFRIPTGTGRFLSVFWNSLGMTFGALLGTLPIQALVFRGLPVITPLANLFLIFPCQLLVYFALAGAVLGLLPIFQGLALPFVFVSGWLSEGILSLKDLLDSQPSFFLDLSDPVWLVALGGCFLLVWMAISFHRDRSGALLAFFLSVFVLGFAWAAQLFVSKETITLATVGDSSSVIVLRNDRAAVLCVGGFDGEGAAELLQRKNVRVVETVCLADTERDRTEAAKAVLGQCQTGQIFIPEDEMLYGPLQRAAENISVRNVSLGDRFTILDHVEVSCSEGLSRMDMVINGVQVTVETGSTSQSRTQLLITDRPDSQVSGEYVIYTGEQDMLARLDEGEPVSAGKYLVPGDAGLFVDIDGQGTVRFRGETDARAF